jgi:lysophospholipase L1-like esterase
MTIPLMLLTCLLPLQLGSDSTNEESVDFHMTTFQQYLDMDWEETFYDPCTENWRECWTLDGLKASITHSEIGMDFISGPVRKENASHAVMWTQESFEGDIRLDYEYTKLDDAVEAVTILYLQATGSDAEGYDKDISLWADQRETPTMAKYHDHMHLLHISYAAFDIGNTDPDSDYIRARRYMPELPTGIANTDLEPDYFRTDLFKKDVPHKITVIKKGNDLFMHIRNSEEELLCHWETDSVPPVIEGRIGLRHMWTRGARYRNFRISQLPKHESEYDVSTESDTTESPEYASPRAKVVCFGDSITKRGYTPIMGELLDVDTVMAGVAGNSTAQALRRMSQDVIAHDPDVVVIFFGTNDLRVDAPNVYVPVDQYAVNLNQMIDACTEEGASVVLCTLPPIEHDAFFARHEREVFDQAGGLAKLVADYRETALEVAETRDIPLVDLYELLLQIPEWQHPDGVHPCSAGNAIIAELIAEAVEPLLGRDTTPDEEFGE